MTRRTGVGDPQGMHKIRPATPDDALAVAQAHVRSWQVGYRGLIPDVVLDNLDPVRRAAQYSFDSRLPGPFTLVAHDAGTICGHVTIGANHDDDLSRNAVAPHGEIWALYVDPARWGTGIGRMLIAAARAQLVLAGYTDAVLWMLDGNTRALRFYEHDGWVLDGARRVERRADGDLHDIRLRRGLP